MKLTEDGSSPLPRAPTFGIQGVDVDIFICDQPYLAILPDPPASWGYV